MQQIDSYRLMYELISDSMLESHARIEKLLEEKSKAPTEQKRKEIEKRIQDYRKQANADSKIKADLLHAFGRFEVELSKEFDNVNQNLTEMQTYLVSRLGDNKVTGLYRKELYSRTPSYISAKNDLINSLKKNEKLRLTAMVDETRGRIISGSSSQYVTGFTMGTSMESLRGAETIIGLKEEETRKGDRIDGTEFKKELEGHRQYDADLQNSELLNRIRENEISELSLVNRALKTEKLSDLDKRKFQIAKPILVDLADIKIQRRKIEEAIRKFNNNPKFAHTLDYLQKMLYKQQRLEEKQQHKADKVMEKNQIEENAKEAFTVKEEEERKLRDIKSLEYLSMQLADAESKHDNDRINQIHAQMQAIQGLTEGERTGALQNGRIAYMKQEMSDRVDQQVRKEIKEEERQIRNENYEFLRKQAVQELQRSGMLSDSYEMVNGDVRNSMSYEQQEQLIQNKINELSLENAIKQQEMLNANERNDLLSQMISEDESRGR